MKDYIKDALKITELGRTMILSLRFENEKLCENKTLRDFTLEDYISGAEALLMVVKDETLPLYATEEDGPRSYTSEERANLERLLRDYIDKYKSPEVSAP